MKRSLLIILGALLILGCQKEVYHNVTAAANPAEAGSVSPSSGPVLDGTSVSFKATPNGDYVFTGWSGSISGTENPKTVTVTQDMNVTANFTLRSYPLAITIEGDGTVAEKVVSTKSEHQSGTVVELTASPSDHWLFDHWDGDITGTTNPAQITVSSAKNVKAVFVEKTYPLNVEIEGEGAVSEKIIQTKATYQEGTVVELTSNPSDGWSFDHWDGDLSGNDNPVQITVSSEKAVKAVFVKNNYSFNVKIVGPGAVDEYLVEQTKATVEYGKQVKLVATPSKWAEFIGWSGDINDNNETIIIDIEKSNDIVATFGYKREKYPLADLSLPSSMLKFRYPEIDFTIYSAHSLGYIPVDYNRDGFIDVVTFLTDWTEESRMPIRFYKSDETGYLSVDEQNDSRLLGMVHNRKSVYGDFNADGYPDIVLIGHGYDNDPWPGEYPVILLSQNGPVYTDLRFPEYVSYYHGGASGDIDNDGDIDLFLVDTGRGKSLFLINDGHGNFEPHLDYIDQSLMFQMTITELFDLDHDGNLDIICAGDDTAGSPDIGWPYETTNLPIVFWGDGTGRYSKYDRLPPSHIRGYDGTIDMTFYDLDGNGIEELIMARTGSTIDEFPIERWAIQILEIRDRKFEDVTEQYLDYEDSYTMVEECTLCWVEFDEYDGNTYLIASKFGANSEFYFKLENHRLLPLWNRPEQTKIENGICLYSDGQKVQDSLADAGCREEKYGGKTSIKFSNWPLWTGWGFDYEDWMDYSYLEKNGYVLEFAIKNTDPDLFISFSFETRLQTDPWYFPAYGYDYDAHNHKCDGSWELVQVPLSEMWCDEEWKAGYYWNTIKTLNIMPAEYHGKDFYIDEIRIRKILPN